MWDIWLYLSLLAISAIGYALWYWRLTPALRFAGMHQIAMALGNGYAAVLYLVMHTKNNLYVFHILTYVQYALLASMYAYTLKQARLQRFALWSIPLFAGFALTCSFTFQPWDQVNSYSRTVSNLLLIFLSGAYINDLFRTGQSIRLEREPLFWISAGVFFTSLGNFFVQALMNYMISQSSQVALRVYWVQELMETLQACMFIIALVVYGRFSKRI